MTVTINGTTGIVAPAFDGAVDAADLTGTVPSSAVPYVSGRNRIINGDMRIDQRNAGASVTPTDVLNATYSLDRWATYGSVASKFSVQRNAGSVTPPSGYSNYLGVTSLSSYSVGAGEFYYLYQVVEGFNMSDFAFGFSSASPVTLSFWVRSSLTGAFSGALTNGGFARSYPFTYTINAANTWEQKTVTVAGDTTGTWTTTNGSGMNVFFNLGSGSNNLGTAGAWTAAGRVGATSSQSVVATNGATFYITGVQLEAGSIATPFERRFYGQELALCQRYYERVNGFDENSLTFCGNTTSGNSYLANGGYKVEKRVAATVTILSENLSGFGSVGATSTGTSGFRTAATASASITAGYFRCSWAASAEL